MKYAIIESGGKQYRVTEGQELSVDKLPINENDKYLFPNVLLVYSGEKVDIGTPYLAEAKVSGHAVKHFQGDKLYVSKFKAKVRYRRTIGYRHQFTKLIIDSIEVNDQKTPKPNEKIVARPKRIRKAVKKTS